MRKRRYSYSFEYSDDGGRTWVAKSGVSESDKKSTFDELHYLHKLWTNQWGEKGRIFRWTETIVTETTKVIDNL